MTKHIQIFGLHEYLLRNIRSSGTSVLDRLMANQAELISLHDRFYTFEIAKGGLTIHQALNEVLRDTYTKGDPNEDTLAYHNAIYLLCREFSNHLSDCPVDTQLIRMHAPDIDRFLCNLKSFSNVPQGVNSAMCLRHRDLPTILSNLNFAEIRTPSIELNQFVTSLENALRSAETTGSDLMIYILDPDKPFLAPVSRQVQELRDAGYDVTEDYINSISIALVN